MKRPVTVYCSFYESPLGRLCLGMTAKGIVALHFPGGSQQDLVASLPYRNPRVIHDNGPSAPIRRQLDRYFRGRPVMFAFRADLGWATPFQRAVWRKLAQLPPGQLITYGQLAREIGQPRAARAVGQAVGANPLPILIPCHRVIAGDGSLGGFTGGVALKKKLLKIEGITL
ncbi:MAG TPA: methylated-DNA--[protein]-cysteine S-methyltransferase [Candidatus Edwardsbacteria bacterium]|nr:methylated-DNA--[protein]-cysteine S-methyltransferase [Candidatus Edwardsbacteria bacterium]